ncbi:MAG: hypothetical protein EBQ97_01205 [Bacteroidetes bacterium]|nr:hypothetical protein [Bacteroidota bacterium]
MNRISVRIFSIFTIFTSTAVLAQSNVDASLSKKSAPASTSALTIDACFSPKYYPKNARLYGWITKTEYAELVDGVLYAVNASTLAKTQIIKADSFVKVGSN